MPALAEAALSDLERRALKAIVGALRGRFGDDLVAVWLYGSRARGERHAESDIDLLVVVRKPIGGASTRSRTSRGVRPTRLGCA
jgi:predicted nucleotidyltransferase